MAFEPDDEYEAPERPRSTFRPSKRRAADAAPPIDPFAEEPTPKKKRKPLAKVVVQAPGWHAWIDPAALLWLPLPLALAFFIGSALFSLILPPAANEDGSTNINFIFLTFSLVLAFLPLAYLLSHWTQVGGAWAQGNTADPPWPDLDVGAILGDFLNVVPGVLFAAACSGWVFFLPVESPLVKTAAASFLFAVYLAVALVAIALQNHGLASNPVSILLALLRMSRGRLAFLAEAAAHLLIGSLLWRAIFLVWERNWDVGLLIWGALWIYAFFSGARLMRAAGLYYRRNAKRVGWFT